MDLEVTFLGTGASAPSARRSTAAVLIARGGERLLFDCGEGTQRQMQKSIGLTQVDEIYLTHFHEDYARMNEVYAGFFPVDRRPARTCIGTTGLAYDARIEIDMIARRPA